MVPFRCRLFWGLAPPVNGWLVQLKPQSVARREERSSMRHLLATVAQQYSVPEAVLSMSTMAPPDYVDLFTISTTRITGGSTERWARAVVEESAGLGGQFIWRVILGLQLGQAPERVGGWEIGGRGENWLRLEAASRLLTAHLVIQAVAGHLSVGTFIRYDTAVARFIWTPLASIHRRLMPGLLRKAVSVFQPTE